jgi:hypothetical protein
MADQQSATSHLALLLLLEEISCQGQQLEMWFYGLV